jgi:hypothetical protein
MTSTAIPRDHRATVLGNLRRDVTFRYVGVIDTTARDPI